MVMAGKIRELIDSIIKESAHNDKVIENIIKAKLVLKGVSPVKYTSQSDDDPVILKKLDTFIKELHSSDRM
jgi:hypothetical protein